MLTKDVDRAISRASVDEALCCCVYGREVGPDEGSQDPMASVGHQAVVLGVPHIVRPSWVLLPPIIPVPATPTCQKKKSMPEGVMTGASVPTSNRELPRMCHVHHYQSMHQGTLTTS